MSQCKTNVAKNVGIFNEVTIYTFLEFHRKMPDSLAHVQ